LLLSILTLSRDQANLLEAANHPDLGGKFDFVNCIGVLHHLASPLAGLQSLNTVLKPDGGMNLMVYGELGRRGIYDFQVRPDPPLFPMEDPYHS
jgi:SAM-dependent methyltransferase